jgi:hypothetical protein
MSHTLAPLPWLRARFWPWFALVLAVAGCGQGPSPEQTKALADIHQLGGKVNFDSGGYEVDFRGSQVENDDLAGLKHIANLKNVDLRGTRISDAGLVHLEGLKTLDRLYLTRSLATEAGAEKVRKALPNTKVTF